MKWWLHMEFTSRVTGNIVVSLVIASYECNHHRDYDFWSVV